MSTKRSRILVMALCAVGLLLWQAGTSCSATFSEDFESGTWPTENVAQCDNHLHVGDFTYGWYGSGCTSCCSYDQAWYYSTEQAHSGTHSMKLKFPRNIPTLGQHGYTEPLPSIKWSPAGAHYTEISFGGWFYLNPTFIVGRHKFIDWRYANGQSDNLILWSNEHGATFHIPINDEYPQGSPVQLKYRELYLCNANGTLRYLARGVWHHVQIYMKLVDSPTYTDTFKVWVDDEIIKVRYGAEGNEIDTPSSNVVDCNMSDIEMVGDAVTHMTWCLNTGSAPDNDDMTMYWDDIFVTDNIQVPPVPRQVHVTP